MMQKMQHIKVMPDTIQETDDEMFTLTRKIYVQTVNMVDDAIVKACYEAAKEVGITDLYLLDKTFVVDALKRAVGGGRWIPQDNTRTKFMCSSCGSRNHDGVGAFCPSCGTRMDGDVRGES